MSLCNTHILCLLCMPIPKEMGEENGSNRRLVKGTGNGSLSHNEHVRQEHLNSVSKSLSRFELDLR